MCVFVATLKVDSTVSKATLPVLQQLFFLDSVVIVIA